MPRCTRLPLGFSLSGQRSYAYVVRAEEGEPGNEAMLAIEPSSCICCNCRDDLSKLSESSFIPRWRKNRERSECSVPECSIFPQKVTKLVTMEQICTIFSMSNPEPPNDETGYPLCATHYGELYRYLHPVNKNCRTCNKRLIERSKFRKCPNPTVIQRFLHENTPFTGDIHAEDIVCIACYKAHFVILKRSSDTVQSLDQDLADAIKNLKHELQDKNEICSEEGALRHAVYKSAILVGEALL